MKPLFIVGLLVLVLGVALLFVPIPHSETHGIKAGDLSLGVKTTEHERLSPVISVVIILAGAGLMLAGRRA